MPLGRQSMLLRTKRRRWDSGSKRRYQRRFSGVSFQLFKAFTYPHQSNAADILEDLGWRVWEDDTDIREEIIDQARSDTGHDPGGTIVLLITRDNGFIDLVDDLKTQGVRVYLAAPEFSSQELVEKVGRRRWIQWERNDFPLLPLRYWVMKNSYESRLKVKQFVKQNWG